MQFFSLFLPECYDMTIFAKKIKHFMLRVIAAVILFCISIQSNAQIFGNEWINPQQQYLKFLIAKEGLYRISGAELKKAGFPTETLNPSNIQIYAKGIEIPLRVFGESDGVLDSTDFIEFYGTYNNGELDRELYRTPAEQPHTFHSLYQDSLPYFITFTENSPGKRSSVYSDMDYSGKVGDTSFTFTGEIYFREAWSDGNPFAGGMGQFSDYTEGEGWMSSPNSGIRNFTLNTPLMHNNGKDALLRFSIYGKNNNSVADPEGFNQEASIFIGSSYPLLYKRKFNGYDKIQDSVAVPLSSIAAVTPCRVSSMSGGRLSISYFGITYQRLFNLSNNSSFAFNYLEGNRYIQFAGYPASKSKPRVYDASNHIWIDATLSAGLLKANLPSTSVSSRIIIADSTDYQNITATSFSPVSFINFDFKNSDYDYIILSHVSLDSGVTLYKDYRSSEAGGNHRVFTGYFPHLYDQYYYGIHHPLAVRNLIHDIIDKQTNRPEHLLIIGKGQTYFRVTFETVNRLYEDLVPTFGAPPSDYALTSSLMPGNLEPAIATGRIPCRTNKQVIDYLEKVKLHETPKNEPWQKQVLHLAGGKENTENSLFRGYLQNYYTTLSSQFFGGSRILFSKSDPLPVDGSLIKQVQNTINDGVSMVTYFGHGSAQVLEIDLGQPSLLQNQGKYPLFYFNGCALGNSFEQYSVPESFLFEPKVGCISWVASTNFGFTSELNQYCDLFHKNLFRDHYGSSIGINLKETIKQYQKPQNDYNINQCRQQIYLGDPAIKLYSPENPDYRVRTSSLTLSASDGNSANKYAVFTVDNLGKASEDTLEIDVVIKTGGGQQVELPTLKKVNVWNNDTVMILLNEIGIEISGLLTFEIRLDPANKIVELSPNGESNNYFSGYLFTSSKGIRSVFPLKDEIIHEPKVKLLVQTLDIYSENIEVLFEIDTTPAFNSPELHRSALITGSNLIEYSYALPPFDSVDYFWRARLNLPENEGGSWINNTFRYIYKSPNGWGQGYFDKFFESEQYQIALIKSERKFDFARTLSGQYAVYTHGKNATASGLNRWIVMDIAGATLDRHGAFTGNGLRFIALNPDDEYRFYDNSPYNINVVNQWWPVAGEYGKRYYTIGKKSGVYEFNTKIKTNRDSLVSVLNRIPDGYHLFLYSGQEMDVDSWSVELLQTFEKFGINKINQNRNGQPYIAVGQKGLEPGSAVEVFPDFQNTTLPPDKQAITYSTKIYPKFDNGYLATPLVGPASKWNRFYLDVNQDVSDQYSIEIIGMAEGEGGPEEEVLITADSTLLVDCSGIDASLYPMLKARIYMTDDSFKTPVQIRNWAFLFDGIAEGTLKPYDNFSLNTDTVVEGQMHQFKTLFENISTNALDSVLVFVTNRNLTSNVIDTLLNRKFKNLEAGDTFQIDLPLQTLHKQGMNEVFIFVNSDGKVQEYSLSNNAILKTYFVSTDQKNPLLDVTFDGIHIMNNDIISPKPRILIQAKDENPYLFLDDANMFEVYLKSPGQDSFMMLDVSSQEFNFSPAKSEQEKAELVYMPQSLANGTYTLKAQILDKSMNPASSVPYEISFKVINESTITHVLPYPNPFSTSARFVYTLTGEHFPEVFNIYIFNINGKLVKTIDLSKTDMMRIGNNISEYVWDGTDEFGDRLAIGTYFYKVEVQVNGKKIVSSDEQNDKYFERGIGKIFIMR